LPDAAFFVDDDRKRRATLAERGVGCIGLG
jgi:hypothetical protein